MASQPSSPEALLRSLFGKSQTSQGITPTFDIPAPEQTITGDPDTGEGNTDLPESGQVPTFQRSQLGNQVNGPQFNQMGLLQYLLAQQAGQSLGQQNGFQMQSATEPVSETNEPVPVNNTPLTIPANAALADSLQTNNAPVTVYRRRGPGIGTAIVIFILFIIIVGALLYFYNSGEGERDYLLY